MVLTISQAPEDDCIPVLMTTGLSVSFVFAVFGHAFLVA